jgi:hypothetical protein
MVKLAHVQTNPTIVARDYKPICKLVGTTLYPPVSSAPWLGNPMKMDVKIAFGESWENRESM